jgi:hypothetical protein
MASFLPMPGHLSFKILLLKEQYKENQMKKAEVDNEAIWEDIVKHAMAVKPVVRASFKEGGTIRKYLSEKAKDVSAKSNATGGHTLNYGHIMDEHLRNKQKLIGEGSTAATDLGRYWER